MDEKLALKFAAWLSPEFERWVFDRIEELLTTGKTEIKSYDPSGIIEGLRLIIRQMETQAQCNHEIREDVDFIRNRVDELEAKIISTDEHYFTIAGYCSLHESLPSFLQKGERTRSN